MDRNLNMKVDIFEDLGNYWKCLSGMDQKRWFAKELYNRNKLNIKTLDDYNMSVLSVSGRDKKIISNVCNYDILQNEKYADMFFYTQMERRRQ